MNSDGPPAVVTGAGLSLPPGLHLVLLSGSAEWRYAAAVRLAVIVGGDPRSMAGPRVTLHHSAALDVQHEVASLRSGVGVAAGRPRRDEVWEGDITRPFSTHGFIYVPPGSDVEVALWASAEDSSLAFGEFVTFSDLTLTALALAQSTD